MSGYFKSPCFLVNQATAILLCLCPGISWYFNLWLHIWLHGFLRFGGFFGGEKIKVSIMTLDWKLYPYIAIFFLVFAYKANIIKIMTKKKSLLGPWEMQFFAWVQFEKKRGSKNWRPCESYGYFSQTRS